MLHLYSAFLGKKKNSFHRAPDNEHCCDAGGNHIE